MRTGFGGLEVGARPQPASSPSPASPRLLCRKRRRLGCSMLVSTIDTPSNNPLESAPHLHREVPGGSALSDGRADRAAAGVRGSTAPRAERRDWPPCLLESGALTRHPAGSEIRLSLA